MYDWDNTTNPEFSAPPRRSTQLTHEVFVTFMFEVTAIINASHLVPVSTDPESPFILTPSMLLTQKKAVSLLWKISARETCSNVSRRELAETFWSRWWKEYIGTCHHKCPEIKEGDIVLLKDKNVKRNEWQMWLIMKAVPSKDSMVRSVELFSTGQ